MRISPENFQSAEGGIKMDFIDLVKIELKFQKHLYKQFDKLRRNKDKGKISCTIRPDGRKKYYITDESGRKYVHKKIRMKSAGCTKYS